MKTVKSKLFIYQLKIAIGMMILFAASCNKPFDEVVVSEPLPALENLEMKKSKQGLIPVKARRNFVTGYAVSGYVRTQSNSPVPNLTVEAFDKKVGQKPNLLGRATTDKQGIYHIDYSKIAVQLLKGQKPDLLVRVYRVRRKVLAQFGLWVDAPQEAHINLSVPDEVNRGPSEFELLHSAVEGLVSPKKFAVMDAEDLGYLATKLQLEFGKVQRFCHAWKLEAVAGKFNPNPAIPATTFYGLVGGNNLPELTELLRRSRENLKWALRQSVAANHISALEEAEIGAQVDALKDLSTLIDQKKWIPKTKMLLNQTSNLNSGGYFGNTKS